MKQNKPIYDRKRTRKCWPALLCCLLSLAAAAQNKHADKLFARWDYYKAAKCYAHTAKKHPSQDVHYKLGESYRMMEKYRQAAMWYDKVYAAGAYSNPDFYLHYGLVLKSTDQCPKAKEVLAKYAAMVPGDTLARFYSNACDLIAEDHHWDEPVSITNLATLNTVSSDFGPVPYRKGVVFASSRKTPNHDYLVYGWTGDYYLDVFYAEKDTNGLQFKKAVQVGENTVDLVYHDGPASFTKNFDTIYISRTFHDLKGRKKRTLNVNRVKIYSAAMGEHRWKRMEPFPYNNDTFSVAHPFVTPDGSRIYFSSDMPGGYGNADLYVCMREGNGWGMPQNLGPMVNTFGREIFPSVDSLGNLYFSSDGYAGFGGLDLCVAWKEKTGGFRQAKVLKSPFNSPMNDFGMAFLHNGKSGYFSSNREGGKGDDDIYYFDLDRDSVPQKLVTSIYTIGYRPYEDLDANVKIHLSFIDSKTRNPIDSGRFWRIDAATQKYDEELFSHAQTEFTVPEKTITRIHALCRFYDLFEDSIVVPNFLHDTTLSFIIALNRTPVKEKIIVMRSDSKVKGKSDQALFDLDKYNIRPDAAKHLDSVVMYMQEYPDAVVDISAHTDSRGSAKYNMTLSEKRAQSAMRYLASKGIAAPRMRAKGYGFTRLVNHCEKGVKCTEAEHQQNRRVEFWIKASF